MYCNKFGYWYLSWELVIVICLFSDWGNTLVGSDFPLQEAHVGSACPQSALGWEHFGGSGRFTSLRFPWLISPSLTNSGMGFEGLRILIPVQGRASIPLMGLRWKGTPSTPLHLPRTCFQQQVAEGRGANAESPPAGSWRRGSPLFLATAAWNGSSASLSWPWFIYSDSQLFYWAFVDFLDWILLNLLFAFRAFPEVLNGGVFSHFTGECGPVELLMLSCQKLISGSHHIHFQNKIYIQEET